MMIQDNQHNNLEAFTIFVLSGSVGASGTQLVNTVLAQFPDHQARVLTVGNLRHKDQLVDAVERARKEGGLIVHTLVNGQLRSELVILAEKQQVPAIDLMGDLMAFLQQKLMHKPAGRPGLYRQLNTIV